MCKLMRMPFNTFQNRDEIHVKKCFIQYALSQKVNVEKLAVSIINVAIFSALAGNYFMQAVATKWCLALCQLDRFSFSSSVGLF